MSVDANYATALILSKGTYSVLTAPYGRQRTSSSVAEGCCSISHVSCNYFFLAFLKRRFDYIAMTVTFGTIVRPFCCARTRRFFGGKPYCGTSQVVFSQRILNSELDITAFRLIAEPVWGDFGSGSQGNERKVRWLSTAMVRPESLSCNPVPQREPFDRVIRISQILSLSSHFQLTPLAVSGKCQRNEISRAWKVLIDYRLLYDSEDMEVCTHST